MDARLGKNNETFQKVLSEIPEIAYAGEPVLRTPTAQVSLEEGLEVAKRLTDILLKYRSVTGLGRGLAAPQIGESKSVFITYVDDVVEVYMNPTIVESSVEKNYFRELCISAGIMAADVARPEWIRLSWIDSAGASREEKFDGFKARLLQHEEAHLRGVINLDESARGGIQFVTFDPAKETLRNTRD